MVKLIPIIWLMGFMAIAILANPCFAIIDPETAVGIYLFEEGEGKEVIDHSGKGHNGTIVGGTGKWVDGKFGLATDIAGKRWVQIENADDLTPVDAWTIVVWFKIEEISANHVIVSKFNEYILRVGKTDEGGKLLAFVAPSGNWASVSFAGLEIGKWTHAAMVWDNREKGLLKLYVDGVQVDPKLTQGEIKHSAFLLCIGSDCGRCCTFPGLLDDVGFFNVALEEGDIKRIMERGLERTLFPGEPVEPQTALAVTWAELKIK